jgi:MHS family alpha-ketoglutarate permease-like MFS transporter
VWGLISNEPWTLMVAQAAGLLLVGFITGCKPASISEQIPTRYRTRMFGVCISLGVAVFGGTASYLTTRLYSENIGWMFNIYLIVVAVIASAVVLLWKNSHGVPIDKI